jgi:hypothetical protein
MFPRLNITVLAQTSQIGPHPALNYSVMQTLQSSLNDSDPLTPPASIDVIATDKNKQINEKMKRIAGGLTFDPLGDPAAILTQLQEIGRWISDRLLPQNCFNCCDGELPETIVIQTDQNDIPWEIAVFQGRFLSEQTVQARFPFVGRGRRIPIRYNVRPRILIVTGVLSDLTHSSTEAHSVSQIYEEIFPGSASNVITKSAVTKVELRHALELGDGVLPYDIIHFIGHGSTEGGKVWLELPDGPFLPDDIPRSIAGNPIVFWNSCFGAASSSVSVKYHPEVSTEFGSRLIAAGASHFLGPVIPVQDMAAQKFSAIFYRHLLTGKSIGQAFFETKTSMSGDYPLVHTYILYGNPFGRLAQHG